MTIFGFHSVIRDFSRPRGMQKGRKCEALKGASPEQVRSLAQHYYKRARQAEDDRAILVDALREACEEVDRLTGLAAEALRQ